MKVNIYDTFDNLPMDYYTPYRSPIDRPRPPFIVSNYDLLYNKPKINNIELKGNQILSIVPQILDHNLTFSITSMSSGE